MLNVLGVAVDYIECCGCRQRRLCRSARVHFAAEKHSPSSIGILSTMLLHDISSFRGCSRSSRRSIASFEGNLARSLPCCSTETASGRPMDQAETTALPFESRAPIASLRDVAEYEDGSVYSEHPNKTRDTDPSIQAEVLRRISFQILR